VTTLVRPREGRLALDGLYEGVPDYLRRPLTRWLENVYTIRPDTLAPVMDEAGLQRLAALLRIDLRGTDGYGMLIGILAWADDDDERLLDVIHYTLQIPTRMPKMWNELEILRAYGSSTWQATEKGLLGRVDETVVKAFNAVVAVPDSASDHLALAWVGAYGRHPHPASAWHHSIKALEASLLEVVFPDNPTATLSDVINELSTGPWTLQVRGRAREYRIDPLIQMLELVWPDPNRHESATLEPGATKEEACAVVQLTAAIVQWRRDGQIVKKSDPGLFDETVVADSIPASAVAATPSSDAHGACAAGSGG
jgi:hypothetical protein